jgi:membrane protease YdiL (CAAX protease family)
LSDPELVRCRGCAVMNPPGFRECIACGTLMPRVEQTKATPASTAADHLRGLLGAQRARGVLRLFVGLVCLVVAAAVARALAVAPAIVELVIRLTFVLLAVVCGLAARPEVGALLTRSGGWRGMVLAVGGFGVMVSVGALYFRGLGWLGFLPDGGPDVYIESGWPRWTPYLLHAAAPAVTEEVIFRGYAMARLDEVLSARESLIVQAALFALLHLGAIIFPSHFAMGLLFGALRRRTRSLYPGMLVHAGWNATITWAELAGLRFP